MSQEKKESFILYLEHEELINELSDEDAVSKVSMLVSELGIDKSILPAIPAAIEKANDSNHHALAIELPNGKIITGRETELLSPASSAIINAIKEITKIPDEIDLLSDTVLKPILSIKKEALVSYYKTLQLQEVLIALSICAVTNPVIKKALNNLSKLKGSNAHCTYILTDSDIIFRSKTL